MPRTLRSVCVGRRFLRTGSALLLLLSTCGSESDDALRLMVLFILLLLLFVSVATLKPLVITSTVAPAELLSAMSSAFNLLLAMQQIHPVKLRP